MDKAKTSQWISEVVRQVLYTIADRKACDKTYVLAVFTGATAGFKQALSSLEFLMLSGISLRVVLSESANHLYGDVVEKQLLAWPCANLLETRNWFDQVKQSKGIVVPMLSVNTLSKTCALTADSLAGNILVHALFSGKPMVAAIDGCAPDSEDRKTMGLDRGTPALQQVLANRLVQLSDFGCCLARSQDMGGVTRRILGQKHVDGPDWVVKSSAPPLGMTSDIGMDPNQKRSLVSQARQIEPVSLVNAAMVRSAQRNGGRIQTAANTVITPLARDLALRFGIEFTR